MASNQIDPLWLAMSKLRRGKLEDCINLCNEILSSNPGDQAAWLTKCKAVVKQNYLDDIELDEEGVAEVLMDEHSMASVPRYLQCHYVICLGDHVNSSNPIGPEHLSTHHRTLPRVEATIRRLDLFLRQDVQ